ncbi:threonine aldolase family protein [Halobacterium litoreum]|uniref:Threonine aldolase family protein n=1 Tax=Halobacterium litoreum TaxID=2039234 RepID=A0ABD5NEY1_9EURY|nr:low specificity L-threonine aldolase [Halobacterium litoreum]UHH13303.1 low specificity L-threonine aldolase [Halobacterium litoreum]
MIDLRSDTVTTPSDEMRAAAADADVGDDVYGEDPTVNDLEARAAEAVGMEAALYVPTGTMGNQIAARVHTERGQEALVERESHVYKWELGGFAQHAELQVRTFDGGENGCPTPEQVREGYVEEDLHRPGTGLLCLENTHNAKGGAAAPAGELAAAADAAHDLGLPVHVDGARVFNAATALGVDASDLLAPADSVMFCLSKGLGAPVGSMLAGSEEFVERATRVRKLLGGGMRQAGIIAAPGIVGLENRERLANDHENATRLASELDEIEGLSVPEPDSNIVLVDTTEAGVTAAEFLDDCEDEGVLGSEFGDYTVRFCTHLDVDAGDVNEAVAAVERVV